jgi:AraC-like DNA-binding protein
MAEARRLSNLGPLGLLIREQPTARLAVEAFALYGRHVNESLLLTIEEAADVVVLREELVIGHAGAVRQSTELAIGVAFRMLRQFLGPDWRAKRVCFAHDAPADRSVHERVFGRCVEFGHDFNGIVCARSDLERPNPDADPELARLARRLLDEESALRSEGAVTAEVRELVVILLSTGTCSIDRAAQHLGIDRRTVHRRLGREGQTFSGIVDAVRREFADRYLEDHRRGLAEVASLLGFDGERILPLVSPAPSRAAVGAPRTQPGAHALEGPVLPNAHNSAGTMSTNMIFTMVCRGRSSRTRCPAGPWARACSRRRGWPDCRRRPTRYRHLRRTACGRRAGRVRGSRASAGHWMKVTHQEC